MSAVAPEIIDVYPLSPLQHGMLFHSLYDPEGGVYVEQRWCTLVGDLDIVAFKQAWLQVVNRHSVLRSEFHWQDMEQPLQAVYDTASLEWQEDNWQTLSAQQQNEHLENYLNQDREHGFLLDQVPLMRLALFRIDDHTHRLVWTYHHLLMDGWCNGILIREVLAAYEALRNDQVFEPPKAQEYRTYIDWLQQRDTDADRSYWKSVLQDVENPTLLELKNGATQGYTNLEHNLSLNLSNALISFAKQHRLTLNTLFQGAISILLSRYTNKDDVLFGATISGRPPELEGASDLLGMFINTVPVRVLTTPTETLLTWLHVLQNAQRDREAHGYVPLTELQALTSVTPGTPLFETLLVFENYPISLQTALASLDVELNIQDTGGYERTSFPLTIVIIPNECIEISVRFDHSRITQKQSKRLCLHLETLLSSMLEAESGTLAELEVLTKDERNLFKPAIHNDQCNTQITNVMESIAAQVNLNATSIALYAFDSQHETMQAFSYRELLNRTFLLSKHLIQKFNIISGARVGILLQRTCDLPVALLSVLATRAAFVPLDRNYPAERLRYIADDAELDLLLHHNDQTFVDATFNHKVTSCDLNSINFFETDIDFYLPSIEPNDIAYLIYTSGSTGKPKGVAITHANFANFLDSMVLLPGITANDKLLAVTTIAFDIAMLEIFLPLSQGASVVMATQEQARDGQALAKLIEEFEITIMQASPATWRLFLTSKWNENTKLKVLCGGEALDGTLAQALLNKCSSLWNMYGPTETTIWSAALQINTDIVIEGTMPIGGAINHTGLRVVDHHLRDCPIGVVGELLIGGDGVSPGYWQRPSLNKERFITLDEKRWFRTGDLVRRREDGLFDFLGRVDFQIKLRGHRIELGEIESTLLAIKGIEQAVVVTQTDKNNDSQLVAFIVGPITMEFSELQIECSKVLPSYMIPIRISKIDAMPLTLNGKVDRKAFKNLFDDEQKIATHHHTEQTPVAEIITNAWRQVLGHNHIQANDNFFILGGHSLTATQLISHLQSVLDVELPLPLLFEKPTLNAFIAAVSENLHGLTKREPIPVLQHEGNQRPLSPAQHRQWLLAGLTPDNPLYGIPTAVEINGPISVTTLRLCFMSLAERHEVLHSYFIEENGSPCARIEQVVVPQIEKVNINSKKELENWLHAQASKAFDLQQPPLWRIGLAKVDDDVHVLAVTMHHILTDGWSMGVMVRELVSLYNALHTNNEKAKELSPLALQYADYADWESRQDYTESLDYWQKQLANMPQKINLPTDFNYPSEQSFVGSTYRFSINKELSDALNALSRRHGATLFMTLLSAYGLLLHRISGVTDLAIGTPVANRTHAELNDLIGLFVNTLVIRLQFNKDQNFEELLEQIRNTTISAFQHQSAPFEQVIERLDVARSQSHTPLFQVLFTLQNAPFEETQIADLSWAPINLDNDTAKFDLSLSMSEQVDGLVAAFEYRKDLFLSSTIERISSLFINILENLVQHSNSNLLDVPLLNTTMREEVLSMGKFSTEIPAPSEPIHVLFSKQVDSTPKAIALIQQEETIYYQALEERSNQLAHYLQQQGVVVEKKVAIWATRSIDTICALLAILKAGGIYVPLDTQSPSERITQLLEDAKPECVISNSNTLPRVLSEHYKCIIIDEIESQLASLPIQPPIVEVTADNLAYILFTSGSTGQPKGVCTPHRGVTRLVKQNAYANFEEGDVYLQAAPLNFDASTLEIWAPLLTGGTLVLPPTSEGPLSLELMGEMIESHSVTTLWLTSGLFNLMVDHELKKMHSVRQLIAGGDVLSLKHVRLAHAALPHTQIINGYGPTENTTFTCCHHFGDLELDMGSKITNAPIGKPIAYTYVYVLDKRLELVPMGVPGELYISGLGMARGYLESPALTAEKFIPNPFFDPRQDEANDVSLSLYRTGDWVQMREDGVLEFRGRADQQVKIRGFRIEPSEIESALLQHPSIERAAVATHGDDAINRRLAAYLVASESADEQTTPDSQLPNNTKLRNFLLDRIPRPLMPSAFMWLPALPLNANGKVDYEALPKPQWSDNSVSNEIVSNDQETLLLEIWSNLLPAGPVQRDSNFFDLGGDSIIALQIVSHASRRGLSLTPMQLFQYQTVAELAAVAANQTTPFIETIPADGEAPLTPIQHWFFEQALPKPSHYNQAVAIRLPIDMDVNRLQQALLSLATLHASLRLRYHQDEKGQWHQTYSEDENLITTCHHNFRDTDPSLQNSEISSIVSNLQSSLDINNGPMMHAAVFEQDTENGYLLVLIAHHLIVDGVSWRILLDDLYLLYAQGSTSVAHQSTNYRAWSEALWEKLPSVQAHLSYWQTVVDHANISIPIDGENIKAFFANQRVQKFKSNKTISGNFLADSNVRELHVVILAALTKCLTDWNQGITPTITLESHGRDGDKLDIALDVSNTMGWFTTLYPFTPDLGEDDDPDPATQLGCLSRALNAVPAGGFSYGLLRYSDREDLNIQPQISFNYLGVLDAVVNSEILFERVPVPGLLHAEENSREHLIDVNCWVERSELIVEWVSDKTVHEENTIEKLAMKMLTNLELFLECKNKSSITEDAISRSGLSEAEKAAVLSQVKFGNDT